MNAYWRAANYLSVGQIYLFDNPLLKKPLTLDQVKPRLLGHWGTTPGLNFLYVHLNRIIKKNDLDMIFVDFIRPQIKYENWDLLKVQIEKDVANVRAMVTI